MTGVRGGTGSATGAIPMRGMGVGHHDDAGGGHGGAGDHGVEQPGGRQRDRGDVVGKSPEQVLLDDLQRPTRHPDRVHGCQQVRTNERDVRGLDRHVRAGAHREAQSLGASLGEGGGVVDAIADHGHVVPLSLELGDDVALVPGQDLGAHVLLRDADLRRHVGGCPGVVPG